MTTPTTASFIFVDRRKTGRGKSLPNRQKLLKRIQDSIKNAKPEDIDSAGVRGAGTNAGNHQSNPVKVARQALAEPTLRYASQTGVVEVVLPGNDQWLKGDEIPISSEDEESGSAGGPGEDGEDDFVVNISRSEFFDVFFEDCILPDLEQTAEKELPEAVMKPAGFQKQGTPGQLSIIRSFRNSVGRRRALSYDDRQELEKLESELNWLYDELSVGDMNPGPAAACRERIEVVKARIDELKAKIAAIPLFEKVDHRYRKQERVLVKSADAVLIMAMDISGSMDEERKRIARKFFSLQYAFIKSKYPNTDLVFIYHTDHAEEVDEDEFFSSRKNGGTIISPAIALAHKIVKERYDASLTNIYFSYAGDGDNFYEDNGQLISEFEDRGFLTKLRHAVYIQVGDESDYGDGPRKTWTALQAVANSSKKLHLIKIEEEGDVFTAFKKVYGKKSTGKK